MEQGPESQSASVICSGGVSAVMGSSDLDEPTFVKVEAPGNQLSCSLPWGANSTIVRTACLLMSERSDMEVLADVALRPSLPGMVLTLITFAVWRA